MMAVENENKDQDKLIDLNRDERIDSWSWTYNN